MKAGTTDTVAPVSYTKSTVNFDRVPSGRVWGGEEQRWAADDGMLQDAATSLLRGSDSSVCAAGGWTPARVPTARHGIGMPRLVMRRTMR